MARANDKKNCLAARPTGFMQIKSLPECDYVIARTCSLLIGCFQPDYLSNEKNKSYE